MNSTKDVVGHIDSSNIINNRNIDINIDTVYIRTNIKKLNEYDDLYSYDELQLTLDEWKDYKTTLIINDINELKKKEEVIDSLQDGNELLKGCIIELANEIFS